MPATVIPVTGLNLGPVGAVSQSDFPLRTPRQVNPTDIYNLNFGEPAVLNPNNTYSSVKQFVLGGDLVVSTTATTTSGSPTVTLASGSLVAVGQVIVAAGVTAGTTVSAISGTTLTLSANATASASGVAISFLTGGLTLVAGAVLGIAVQNTRTNGTFPLAGTLGAFTPAGFYAPGTIGDVLVQGTCNIQVNNGTPTAGGTVYVRVALNGAIPAGVIGGFEAASDGGNTVAVTCMKFKTGVLGPDNTAQVTIPTRVMP